MKIGLLQLSDIHFREGEQNPVADRAEAIARAVCTEGSEVDGLILLLTGDVAFSGKTGEYVVAEKFVQLVYDELTSRGKAPAALVIVPGNHDCDFDRDDEVRRQLIQSPAAFTDESVVRACTGVQQGYDQFARTVKGLSIENGKLLTQQTVVIKDQPVNLFLFNSAWMSKEREQGGSICVPRDFEPAQVEGASSTLNIWLMHHPYAWFEPESQKRLRGVIEKRADIVLTGHEHDTASYVRQSPDARVNYVEGGVLQESPKSSASSFNLVVVDLDEKKYRVAEFVNENGVYQPSNADRWFEYVRNMACIDAKSSLSSKFVDELSDPGASFSHPRKAHLLIDDIFVYPDIRTVPFDRGRSGEIVRNVIAFVCSEKKVVLVGGEKSGKSCLARRIVADLHREGYYPVLASGDRFHPTSHRALRKSLRKLIKKQYSPQSEDLILQSMKEKGCIVLDDFYLSKLPFGGRDALLALLANESHLVVVLTNDDERLQCLSHSGEDVVGQAIFSYAHADIMAMGHVVRGKLVRKWVWLNRDILNCDEEKVEREFVQAEKVLSGIIGSNLVPAYPIFVLILLQQMEAGKASDTGAGSQGYLYQALIEASLREIAPNPHDLDSRFSYLTELAWAMSQSSEGGGLGAEALRHWHDEYCDMHLVEYEWTRTLSEFIDAGILREVDDCVHFAYPYIQYFFIARYLRSHIHEKHVRAKVADLAKELHVEKSATVMIFLAHLTSDPFVLESVLSVADTMFESSDEWDTTSHAGYFNSLLVDDPELTLLERTLEDNRFEELQRKDDQELERKRVAHDPLSEGGGVEDQIEEVLNVNSALKMIQVLGQILRSYPGSLKGDMKVRLANACYRLGFRVAGFALHGIESNGEEILNQLTDNLAQIRPEMNAGKRSENASAFLFALCDRFVFGVVRHISQSLGHEALAPVFRKVAAGSGGAASYRLVDLAIKLEHASQVPVEEAIKLYESDRKNKLVVTAVRRLVWYHLYLFPVNYRTRQRLCDKLAISGPDRLSGQRQKLVPKGYKA